MKRAAEGDSKSFEAQRDASARVAVEHGSTAILRLTWTAVVARNIGPFREGQVLTAHIAQFIETRDGRIASIETFDCYEPF
jgi:ketosteroid isomerase-like protein